MTCSPKDISIRFVVSIKRLVLIAVKRFSKIEKVKSKIANGNKLLTPPCPITLSIIC